MSKKSSKKSNKRQKCEGKVKESYKNSIGKYKKGGKDRKRQKTSRLDLKSHDRIILT